MFQVSGPEKSAKGKIILIITPARRCSHLCLPYVCLFVCLLVGDRPSPVFSILPCFFLSAGGVNNCGIRNTEEYLADTRAAAPAEFPHPNCCCTYFACKNAIVFGFSFRPKYLFAQMFAPFQLFGFDSCCPLRAQNLWNWRMPDYLMGGNVNVPYAAVGFDLVFGAFRCLIYISLKLLRKSMVLHFSRSYLATKENTSKYLKVVVIVDRRISFSDR